MHATLVSANSSLVTRAQLQSLAPPPATATWKPIAHYDLIEAIGRQLAVRDIRIVKEEFALAHDDLRLFGVLELEVPGVIATHDYRTWPGPITAWAVHNMITTAVKQLSPASLFQATTRLGTFFGLVATS